MAEFDLFKLHSGIDISNQSWICFEGPNLYSIVEKIRQELINKYNLSSTKKLCKIVAQKLGCKMWTVEQILYHHKKWIPIPILQILVNMVDNLEEYKKSILKDIIYLKCNSATYIRKIYRNIKES